MRKPTMVHTFLVVTAAREVLLGLASILRDQGKTKEATKYAEELAAVMPESAEAKRLLEEIRSKGGR